MDDLLREFLTETNESLTTLDVELVKLEHDPEDPALIGGIFRLVHTIKGTCGFLGLPRLEKVAHAGENVLGMIRDGTLRASPEVVGLTLQCLDCIKSLVARLETSGAEPEGSDSVLIDALNKVAGIGGAGAQDAHAAALESAFAAARNPAPTAEPDAPLSLEPEVAQQAVEVADLTGQRDEAQTTAADARSASREGAEGKESAVAAQSIRVNVDLLENLMTMVSELVLTRNQLLQLLRGQRESSFSVPLQRLNHITSELQESVMKTRMQPIGNAWAKLPRLVRDLGHDLGKKIELDMIGADTDLDRQVLEMIKDPLTHMVRNSADHGLETGAERIAAGKREIGRIRLNAYHEGGQIVIEVGDDGRGLSIDRIRKKAVSQGLATEAEIAAMSDQQVAQFIFRAGFSTASTVTSVSGRGVGMDVVRTNIERIGGTVEVQSNPGRGTNFVIRIPLTLAIVSALIMECAGERFAIPQIGVLELVRAGAGTELPIEKMNNARMLRLRNRLMPLVSLREILGLGAEPDQGDRASFVVVSQVGALTFGLIVDRVFDTEEIVVKPVAPILRNISVFAGNTILGDGSVIMILDPNGMSEVIGNSAVAAAEAEERASADAVQERIAMLIFKAGGVAPKAVPLGLVARLEEIEVAAIEQSDGRSMVQYRGALMPLQPSHAGQKLRTEGRQPILVFADGRNTMGLVVDEIVDIVEESLNIQMVGEQPGILGSAVIAGKAMDVIDTQHFLLQAFSHQNAVKDTGTAHGTRNRRVLLVDDSPFFRNLLSPLLQLAGYHVTTAESAAQALKMCGQGQDFDAVVSDVEMPGMSGFEFAETLRRDERWSNKPIVALSTSISDDDLNRGRAVGFTDYIAKHDRDALLSTLSQAIRTRSAA
jgi:two-component system, chemotaxis family, sensor kinase CheA